MSGHPTDKIRSSKLNFHWRKALISTVSRFHSGKLGPRPQSVYEGCVSDTLRVEIASLFPSSVC